MWNLLKICGTMIFAIFLAVPASAQTQEHDHSQYAEVITNSDAPNYGAENGPESRGAAAAMAENMRRIACAEMERERREGPKGKPGDWGYGHLQAHCEGWIDELIRIQGRSCCSGVHSGECRISVVNLEIRKVLVEGIWCELGGVTPIVIPNMGAFALVCANKKPFLPGSCPSIHCLGIGGGT
jgi:hypothetical protein